MRKPDITCKRTDELFITEWSAIRERGRWRYVVLYGVIPWLAGFVILRALAEYLLNNKGWWIHILVVGPFAAAAGLLTGRISWNQNEKKYRRLEHQHSIGSPEIYR